MEKAFSYRFYPNPEQESLSRRTLGCVRLVYNKALPERTQAWYQRLERIGYSQRSSMLTQWKKQDDLAFLNDVSSVPLQKSLLHLQTAFNNFFASKSKKPKFRKKHQGGSAEFTKSAFKFIVLIVELTTIEILTQVKIFWPLSLAVSVCGASVRPFRE